MSPRNALPFDLAVDLELRSTLGMFLVGSALSHVCVCVCIGIRSLRCRVGCADLEVTQSFGCAAGLRLKAAKCVRFARIAAGRRQLRACSGPPVREAFLDLGVAQHAVSARGEPPHPAAHAAIGP